MAGLPTGYLLQRGEVYHWVYCYKKRRHFQSLNTTHRDKAEKLLEEKIRAVRASIINGTYQEKPAKDLAAKIPKTDNDTIADALQRYLTTDKGRNPGEATVDQYTKQYGIFLKWINNKHPTAATRADVTDDIAREFFKHLLDERHLSSGTFNKYLDLLSGVWTELNRAIHGTTNPWTVITRKKGRQNRRKPFSEEELRRIIDKATGQRKTLFLLGIYTGQRLGDNCMLKWDRLDFKNNTISVTPGKTLHSSGLEVELPLHPELRAHLLKIKRRKSPYVIPDIAAMYRDEGPRSTLVSEVQEFLRGLGLQIHKPQEGEVKKRAIVQYSYHSLRHAFVTICIRAGISREVVRSIVGDSFLIYTHIDLADKQRAIACMPSLCSKKTSAVQKDSADYSKLSDDALEKTLKETQLELERRRQESHIQAG